MNKGFSILIFLILVLQVDATYVGDDPDLNDWSEVDFSNIPNSDWDDLISEYIPKDRYDDPNIPWDTIDQSLVPKGNVGAIPKDHLKLNGENAVSDEQLGGLTPEQLDGRAKDLEGRDLDLLNPDAKNQLLAELTPATGPPKVETEPDTTFEGKGDHVEFNKLMKYTTPTFQFTDAENIKVYQNGCWDIEKASIIDFFGVSNSDVSNFDGCQDREYHIDSADSIRAGCFDARGVTNADFEINDGLCI